MTWHTRTLYGFDTETTGVDVFTDRIVTATIVKIDNGKVADHRSWLIDPGIEIPEAATKVHGITTDHARANGLHPTEALGHIANTLAGVLRARLPLVVFNAAYDLSIVEAETARYDLTGVRAQTEPDHWHTVIDPMVLAKGLEQNLRNKYIRGTGTYKLPTLCERWGVPFTETHDATADAVGATLLAIALAADEPEFTTRSPLELHTLQKTWRRGHQDSLRRYFDKKGQDHDGVDASWPLHSRLTTAVPA